MMYDSLQQEKICNTVPLKTVGGLLPFIGEGCRQRVLEYYYNTFGYILAKWNKYFNMVFHASARQPLVFGSRVCLFGAM